MASYVLSSRQAYASVQAQLLQQMGLMFTADEIADARAIIHEAMPPTPE